MNPNLMAYLFGSQSQPGQGFAQNLGVPSMPQMPMMDMNPAMANMPMQQEAQPMPQPERNPLMAGAESALKTIQQSYAPKEKDRENAFWKGLGKFGQEMMKSTALHRTERFGKAFNAGMDEFNQELDQSSLINYQMQQQAMKMAAEQQREQRLKQQFDQKMAMEARRLNSITPYQQERLRIEKEKLGAKQTKEKAKHKEYNLTDIVQLPDKSKINISEANLTSFPEMSKTDIPKYANADTSLASMIHDNQHAKDLLLAHNALVQSYGPKGIMDPSDPNLGKFARSYNEIFGTSFKNEKASQLARSQNLINSVFQKMRLKGERDLEGGGKMLQGLTQMMEKYGTFANPSNRHSTEQALDLLNENAARLNNDILSKRLSHKTGRYISADEARNIYSQYKLNDEDSANVPNYDETDSMSQTQMDLMKNREKVAVDKFMRKHPEHKNEDRKKIAEILRASGKL